MIVEMLAGDELAPFRRDAVVATGFLARNWYKFDRDSWLNDAIDHTARAFLAVTMRCARCHDHKYDPISQEEYYRLRAIFEPHDVRIDLAPGEEDVDKHGMARVCDARPDEPTYLFVRGNPNQPDESERIEPGLPHILGGNYQTSPVKLSSDNYYPALRDLAVQDKFAELRRKVSAAYRAAESLRSNDEPDQAELTTAEKELDAALAELASYEARLAAERNRMGLTSSPAGESSLEDLTVAATAAQRRANLSRAEADVQAAKLQLERAKAAESDDDEASRQAVQSANKEFQAAEERLKAVVKGETDGESSLPYDPLGPNCPPVSTGRRLALARWIVQPENPLTARVAVNHIWMRHFGSPLVDHVDDFGLRSPRPPLMDLLDYLASELIESGWSMKHVHRLIATSAVYRRRSSVGSDSSAPADTYAATRAADPDNHYYWRMNIRRADAESVRDALLLASGRLDASLGGPDIDHHREAEIARRSLYFRHAREKQMKFLMIFDAANPSECYRREESIRPQQAFALINSRLVSDESKRLADRLINELTNGAGASQADRSTPLNGRFIVAAFETILSRRPIPAEMEACQEFLAGQTELLRASEDLELLDSEQVDGVALPSSDPAHRARQNLVLVLFNQNDFVTIR